VAVEMLIGMNIMAQTPFKRFSRSRINEKKAEQDGSESCHSDHFYIRLCPVSRYVIKSLALQLL
jgi:hypothetical protein